MSIAERISEWLPILWFALTVLVLLALWASGALDKLLKRLTKFGGFGLSFELTAESARETRESVQSSLATVRATVTSKLTGDVRSSNMFEIFRSVMDDIPDLGPTGYRATIHVQDPLFENQLFQLLDYFPRGPGTAGRTFSVRAGIIGMAWRTREPRVWNQASEISPEDLIRMWGMTPDEASQRLASDKKKLFLAQPLFATTGARLGIFYVDADDWHAIGLESPSDDAAEEQRKQASAEADQRLEAIGLEFVRRFKDQMRPKLESLVDDTMKSSPLLNLEGT